MRVLIVDDEQPARDKLQRMLADSEVTDVTDLRCATDGIQALDMVATYWPDVVFLDIQMPEISGLEVAASLPDPAPIVIFVTAYDQYAVQAFDANAIDYLLKPYDQDRLDRALRRADDRLQLNGHASKSIAESVDDAPAIDIGPRTTLPAIPPVDQLLICERGITRVIRVDQIEWLETADNYVILHMADGQPLMRQTLTALLDRVGSDFVRCHRRAAVRRSAIERLIAQDKGDGQVQMRSGALVPYSRQFRATLIAMLV